MIVGLSKKPLVDFLLCPSFIEVERFPDEVALFDDHVIDLFLSKTWLLFGIRLHSCFTKKLSLKLLNIV